MEDVGEHRAPGRTEARACPPPHRPWRPLQAGAETASRCLQSQGGRTLRPSPSRPQARFLVTLRAHCGAGGGQLVWICQ